MVAQCVEVDHPRETCAAAVHDDYQKDLVIAILNDGDRGEVLEEVHAPGFSVNSDCEGGSHGLYRACGTYDEVRVHVEGAAGVDLLVAAGACQ